MFEVSKQCQKYARTLKADGTHIIKCWVDASYAIHNFMKSQNLGVMTLERFIHG